MEILDCRLELPELSSEPIIGNHPLIEKAIIATQRARNLRILFTGETGVGKTPFAKYSRNVVMSFTKRYRPFEQINCASLSPEHFQDTMFGHKKGAFTGSVSDKKGLVEIACDGDLFLDEIGDMPIETQGHLLTFLDTMEYYKLGDDQKRKATVRILSATNANLRELIRQGRFRKDLYSRLSQVVVQIPPLRCRRSDLTLLTKYFIKHFCGFNKPISQEAISKILENTWEEGNVRQLRDKIEFLCAISMDSEIISWVPSADYEEENLEPTTTTADELNTDQIYQQGLNHYLRLAEATVLQKILKSHPQNITKLATNLRVSRATLYRKLKQLKLTDYLDV